MSLKERFGELVRAAFAGVWIVSYEKNDAIRELADLCREESWTLSTWNVATGLTVNGQKVPDAATDPLAAVKAAEAVCAGEDTTSVLVLEDFHHFLQSPEIIASVAHQVLLGKQTRSVLVVLSPIVKLPVELEKLFTIIEHELPDRAQLRTIASELATEEGELPEGEAMDRVLDAATGLTRLEAENAFALSLVQHSRLEPHTLWTQKSQILAKSGALTLYEGNASFDSLGGMASLKAFTKRALTRSSSDGVRARGVMLLSPPGCGKSEFCKALGREIGRPVLQLDIGALMGSLVGQSEERTRQALAVVDTMSGVLYIDEIEKGFACVGGTGGDSGVSSRVFGTILTYLQDRDSDVFVVATSNDISRLPPEFTRSERFDATFFIDLPGQSERDAIWSMYMDHFGLDQDQKRPDDDGWTGAEIRSACRLSALLDVPIVQAATNVVPVSVTAAETIDALRKWASGRCLDAQQPGIYRGSGNTARRRRVARAEPSDN